ncbi:hypothetical protein EKK58_04070 [Candidatus Dependentiae bacterium]|nr:MAG: hypothetical protein EKK58_04070 [Candidatus Dependentiae bacterium]
MKGLFRMAYCTNRYALLLPLLLYGLHMLTGKILFVKKTVFSVEHGSVLCKQQLADFVKPLYGNTALSIVKHINKQFPFFDDITVVRTVDQTLYCDVRLKDIAYCIDENLIITTDGQIYSVLYFDPSVVQVAKKCSINKNVLDQHFNTVFSFLNHISPDIFIAYHIVIRDPYEVFLYPHDTRAYFIKCTLATNVNQNLIDRAIKQTPLLKQMYPTLFTKNQAIHIDMRFKDQIVFTTKKKE